MVKRLLVNLVGIALMLVVPPYLVRNDLPSPWEPVLIVGCTGWMYLTAWLGRRALRRPSSLRESHTDRLARVQWVTTLVHYTLFIPFATSITLAGKWATEARDPRLPVLAGLTVAVGWALLVPGVALVASAVLSLAVKGLGAPWAARLTARLAHDWPYRYTRNPMVLGAFGVLLG